MPGRVSDEDRLDMVTVTNALDADLSQNTLIIHFGENTPISYTFGSRICAMPFH